MDLITVGDVMVDVHVESPALARGGDVHGRVRLQPAGTSANAAVWAVWDGASAGVYAGVGQDLAGRLLGEALIERGVDPVLTLVPGAPSGTMLVVVEEGERSMVADRGANARLQPADLPPLLEAGAVLISGYLSLQDPTTDAAIAAIERARARFVAVESSSWPLLEAFGPERFLALTSGAGADTILANAREAESLTGRTGAESARALGERFRVAGVKLGARGAVMSFEGAVVQAQGESIVEVDPTGSGDAFDGVLLAALARDAEPAEALYRACHAGALGAASPETWPEVAT